MRIIDFPLIYFNTFSERLDVLSEVFLRIGRDSP